MELRQLRYFQMLAEELHFGRAAQRLGIAQPALTQQIQSLERDLGARLFQRTKRSVHLTIAGRLTLEQATRTLEQAERTATIARKAGRGEQGSVEIGYVGSAAFSGILSKITFDYRKTNPDIELHLHELDITQQVDDVSNGRIDVGFIRPPVRQWPDGMASLTLSREPIIIALPKGHPLSRRRAVPLAALTNESFITTYFEEGVGFHAQVAAMCRAGDLAPRITQRGRQFAAITSLVGAGLGVAFAPDSLRNLRVPNVVYRPLDGAKGTTELALIFRKFEQAPAAVSFIAKARQFTRAK
jgi:DNA-binding transcriptional LysR family regulator